MFKDLLVPLTGTPGDEAALDFAVAMARREQARVAALAVTSLWLPADSPWGIGPSEIFAGLQSEARERSEQLAEAARQRLRPSGVDWEVRIAETRQIPSHDIAAMHARYVDLVVLTAASGGDAQDWVQRFFADALMDSGRPVMVVPPQYTSDAAPTEALIAWQPGREASRAVHDALPLLRACRSVTVLCVDPQVDDLAHGEEPGADVGAHLARHGRDVRVMTQQALGESTGEVILRQVLEVGADLLVAGGYSRSRWRELILGGVTRTLFEQSPVPVLFSH